MTPAIAVCTSCNRDFKAPIDALRRTADAQANRDFLGLLDDIRRIESDNRLGDNVGITGMSPEHWPLSI